MRSYKTLALRYLKQNKQRSIITILGTTLTVMILYALLNMGWGYLLQTRQDIRETQDYEIVLFTETEEQITELLQDTRIKSAYVGQYYSYHNGTGTMYEHALYINTVNPYKIDSIYDQLCTTYEVGGDIHNELAWTYLQGSDGSFVVVVIYFSILVAFIFAIIGVGIIRNSIQLCMYENIRDYGNLRCIGSSKGQLKEIIFLQGMVLELIGIAVGSGLGTILTLIASVVFQKREWFHFQGGFHLLPLVLILLTFLFDLYFAMGENAKLVTKMSPVSAIRGEYRIRKEKFKLREKNPLRILMAKLFGLDGDYAFKSLMRSPGRFWRTIGALVFGIAAFMVIATYANLLQDSIQKEIGEYGYYQIYFDNTLDVDETISQVEMTLPSQEMLQALSNLKEVTEAKRGYRAVGYAASLDMIRNHYSEEYEETLSGAWGEESYQKAKSSLEDTENEDDYVVLNSIIGITCIGYDEEELARCQSELVAGTVDISDNGVVLVNQTDAAVENTSGNEEDGYDNLSVPLTDYQIGDTIEIVDIGKMHESLDTPLSELHAVYWDMYEADYEADPEDDDRSLMNILYEYQTKKNQMINACWQELAAEGYYKTYVIEGIINEDVNFEKMYGGNDVCQVLMTQEAYFDLTRTDATQPTGMFYHIKKLPKAQELLLYRETETNDYSSGYGLEYSDYSICETSWLIESAVYYQQIRRILFGAALVVIFVLTLSMLNSINVTASNLHLRRRELAQLRVIGMSKKHLMRMVMLEGVLTAVVASLIGIVLGFAFSYAIFISLAVVYGWQYHFPILVAVLAVVISILVLCGSIYFPIRRLGNDLADDLKTGGD